MALTEPKTDADNSCPMVVIEAIQTTTMSASMTAYSVALAPSSSRTSRENQDSRVAKVTATSPYRNDTLR